MENILREQVLIQRYLGKDSNGNVVESESDMYRRVINAVLKAESECGLSQDKINELADRYYELMVNGCFLPNSPTLMNAGKKNGLLSACFVLPIEDSVDGIFNTVKNTALIQKAGGGTGFSFDRLRPTGDIVASSGGQTSGPLSFCKVYSEATNAIQQGAFRRGANMAMISIGHPDALKFIIAKQDHTAFNNFNFSIKLNDIFMAKLENDSASPHIVINPRTGNKYYIPRNINSEAYTIHDLVELGQDGDFYTILDIWNIIVKNAHLTGEPGLCFIDRVNHSNPTPDLGNIEASNPCGEQPLLPYEACNLGSINVSKFITNDESKINKAALKDAIYDAVRFLDCVIDINYYPLPEIEDICQDNRKIGLGIMGFADALVELGIRYDSHEAVRFAEELACYFQECAHNASEELAKEKGVFINWCDSLWDKQYNKDMRNAAVTTIAPTGTISIIAGCNGGIEPIFSYAYKRRALDGQKFVELHPIVQRLGSEQGWLSDSVMHKLVDGISPVNISEIPGHVSQAMVTAHEIAPEWHVKIQAAFQKHIDNAVSKTVNLASDAKVSDVDKVFKLAYKLGCKGVTVYRDKCRDNQVISSCYDSGPALIIPRNRARANSGRTTKFNIGCGKLYVSVNQDEHGLSEVFANLGKAGGCPAQSEATCRILSVAIRSGVDPEVLIDQLKGIRCLSTISKKKLDDEIDVLSCPDAIARAIREATCDSGLVIDYIENKCPDCGSGLHFEAGCNVCDNCGYSKCG